MSPSTSEIQAPGYLAAPPTAPSPSQGSISGGNALPSNHQTLGKPKDVTFAKLCDLKFPLEVKM